MSDGAAVCRACGRSAAEAPSLPHDYASRSGHWAFCGHLGQSALAHGSAVGLSDCLGAGDLSLNVIGGLWLRFLVPLFPIASLGCACRFMLGGSGSLIARFSLSWGSSGLNRVKFLIRRASRTRSQRGAHGAGLGRSRRECKRHFALFKAALRPAPGRGMRVGGSWMLAVALGRNNRDAPQSRRRAIVERAQCVVRRMPCGRFAQCHAFFLLIFSDRRAWNRRRRWLAALGSFIAGRNVEFNGWGGSRESTKMRVFVAGPPAP